MANNFLSFCPTDTSTNLLTQAEYAAATDRTIGNQPGVASSKLNNKALRQATYVAGQVAQYVSDSLAADVLDDNTPARLLAQINAVMAVRSPVVTKYVSGSNTWNKTYIFGIASGNATIGATYTNNGVTYTVSATIVSGTSLYATGNGAPTVSGTLTKASGTGDATITFYAHRSALYLRVRMVGGGGGGAGSGSAPGSDGTVGGDTTFGSSFLTAGGGGFGLNGAVGASGAGGSVTVNSGATGISIEGAPGDYIPVSGVSALYTGPGGSGGQSALGGRGVGVHEQVGGTAKANSGSGGGGGALNGGSGEFQGNGGGSGGFIDVIVPSPASSYSAVVGAAGAAGGAGTGGLAGGAGAAGLIEVTEYFQ